MILNFIYFSSKQLQQNEQQNKRIQDSGSHALYLFDRQVLKLELKLKKYYNG